MILIVTLIHTYSVCHTLSPNWSDLVTLNSGNTNYPGKPRSAILYSTGRSVSITTTALEPTYPWDLDSNDDDMLDDEDDDDYVEDDDDDEDLAGESYVINDKDKDYQHPSMETSRT